MWGTEVKGKDNFVEDSERQVGRLTKRFKDDIEKKNINFAVIDVGSHRTRLDLDKEKFLSAVHLIYTWTLKAEDELNFTYSSLM